MASTKHILKFILMKYCLLSHKETIRAVGNCQVLLYQLEVFNVSILTYYSYDMWNPSYTSTKTTSLFWHLFSYITKSFGKNMVQSYYRNLAFIRFKHLRWNLIVFKFQPIIQFEMWFMTMIELKQIVIVTLWR